MRDSHSCFQVIVYSLACLFALGFGGCGDDDDPVDTTPPTITSTSPANSATDVSLSSNITASFSESMDASTINSSTFTLVQGATAVVGTVTYSSNPGAAFDPTSDLLPNTVYTATITTDIEDEAGNALASAHVWSFTTGSAPDVTPPTVIATIPLNGASGVSAGTAVAATFSEALNPATVTSATFTLTQGATPITGTVGFSGTVATFIPDDDLAAYTVYTATITTGVADLSGNTLAVASIWSFTTAISGDATPPTIISTLPANAATNVAIDADLAVGFSEAMNSSTLNGTTFTLRQGVSLVLGTVSYAGTVATLNPTSNLAYSTVYTATITTGVTDVAGNALAAQSVWSFTTAAAPDATAPTVTETVPLNAAVGVSASANLTATFSEAMNAATIIGSNFMLMQGGTHLNGAVTYSGNTLTFNPSGDLALGAVHTATIFTGVTDLAGNHLAANYVWTFTTSAAPDVTPPTVQSTVPANAAIEVSVGASITAEFSETMNALTITAATFTLSQGATPIVGTVGYSGTTATFTPSSALSPGLVYTATITTGANDLAGNGLGADYVWSFTTAGTAGPPPEVVSTSPEDESIDIGTVTNVTATFSEAMNASTINNSTFTLRNGATNVPGVVNYSGSTATFNPSVNLTPSTIYAATITMGATDLGGVPLAADFAWIFTTEAVPAVDVAVPPNGAFNVALTANVAVSFTKPMNAASITTSNFTLHDGASPVAGVVSYSGVTAVFNPNSNLSPSTLYTASATNTVTDVSGNAMLANYEWSFMTGSSLDTEAPTITSTDPSNDEINVVLGGIIRVFFSEAMDPSTLTSSTFTIRQGATVIPGTVTYTDLQVGIFTLDNLLAPNTVYTGTVSTTVKDISGNALAAETVWSFTTGP